VYPKSLKIWRNDVEHTSLLFSFLVLLKYENVLLMKLMLLEAYFNRDYLISDKCSTKCTKKKKKCSESKSRSMNFSSVGATGKALKIQSEFYLT
jgi:hypothetical protein